MNEIQLFWNNTTARKQLRYRVAFLYEDWDCGDRGRMEELRCIAVRMEQAVGYVSGIFFAVGDI